MGLTTAKRVAAAVGIPQEQMLQIRPGLIAVPSSYRAAVIAAFPAQPPYQKWLQRDYRASYIPCTVDWGIWVLHKGPLYFPNENPPRFCLPTAAIAGAELGEPLVVFNEVVSSTWFYGVEAHMWKPTGIARALLDQDGTRWSQADVGYTSARPESFDGHSLGARWRANANGSGIITAGASGSFPPNTIVDYVDMNLSWSVASPLGDRDAAQQDMMLISGPTALTRVELYPSGFEVWTVTNHELHTALATIAPTITDLNQRVKLQRQLTQLALYPDGCLVKCKLRSVNPFLYNPPTRAKAGDLWAGTTTDEAFDAAVAKIKAAAAGDSPTQGWLYGGVSGPADAQHAEELFASLPQAVSFTVSASGEFVVAPGLGGSTPDELVAIGEGIKATGRTLTVLYNAPPAPSTELDVALARLRGAYTPEPVSYVTSPSSVGNAPFAAAAAVGFAEQPLSKASRDMVDFVFAPGVLDALVGRT